MTTENEKLKKRLEMMNQELAKRKRKLKKHNRKKIKLFNNTSDCSKNEFCIEEEPGTSFLQKAIGRQNVHTDLVAISTGTLRVHTNSIDNRDASSKHECKLAHSQEIFTTPSNTYCITDQESFSSYGRDVENDLDIRLYQSNISKLEEETIGNLDTDTKLSKTPERGFSNDNLSPVLTQKNSAVKKTLKPQDRHSEKKRKHHCHSPSVISCKSSSLINSSSDTILLVEESQTDTQTNIPLTINHNNDDLHNVNDSLSPVNDTCLLGNQTDANMPLTISHTTTKSDLLTQLEETFIPDNKTAQAITCSVNDIVPVVKEMNVTLDNTINVKHGSIDQCTVQLARKKGLVIAAFCGQNCLVLVQEMEVSFWYLHRNFWNQEGSLPRERVELGIPLGWKGTSTYSSGEKIFTCLELWVNEENEDSALTSVVYSYIVTNKIYSSYSVELKQIPGCITNTRMCLLPEMSVVISWMSGRNATFSSISKCSLDDDSQSILKSVKLTPVKGAVNSLHFLKGCLAVVLGENASCIYIWEHCTGALIRTIHFQRSNSILQWVDEDKNVPRVVADYSNPLEKYNDVQFLRRFRFTKDTVVQRIMPIFVEERETNRGLPLPPIIKVTTALRFYATGSFQVVCGDLLQISQASANRIIKEVSGRLARQLPNSVHFPETLFEKRQVKTDFFNMQGFPNVLGCIDCTHVPIINPGGPNAEVFRNRKGWMSLNVQAVTGPQLQIFDVVIRWPGSTHDSRIFDNSSVKARLEEGDLQNSLLLGDSGYRQTKYLYTPVQDPQAEAEERYNYALTSTRTSVERTFGVLKRRFPCLSAKLRTKLRTTTRIIAACVVLHNIGRMWDRQDFQMEVNENAWNNLLIDAPNVRENDRGRVIKNIFIQRHFAR